MSTYTWSIPAGKEITGSTYLKDTDNYLGDTINDLVDFVNGEGLHENQGMTYDFVDKASDQTIAGVKTFTSSPIVPTPTTNFQSATKQYVDDNNKINTLTNKTTPVDADEMVIADSGSSFSLKKLSFSNLKATLIGIGQTWQDVTASRSAGVIYTNSTGKPIFISAGIDGTAAYSRSLNIDGLVVDSSSSTVSSSFRLKGIVPTGSTYSISDSVSFWLELR